MNICGNIDRSTQMCYNGCIIEVGGTIMTVAEIVKELIKTTDLQQAEVARLMGWTPQNLSNRLGRNTLYAEDFMKLLDVIGYKAVIVEKETEEEVKTRKRGIAPRLQMMVNGVKYDTYKADALCHTEPIQDCMFHELYQNEEGEYFLAQVMLCEGGVDSITPVTEEAAKKLMGLMKPNEL